MLMTAEKISGATDPIEAVPGKGKKQSESPPVDTDIVDIWLAYDGQIPLSHEFFNLLPAFRVVRAARASAADNPHTQE